MTKVESTTFSIWSDKATIAYVDIIEGEHKYTRVDIRLDDNPMKAINLYLPYGGRLEYVG